MTERESYVAVFRTRPRGDFLVEPFRLRRGATSDFDAGGVTKLLVPKQEYVHAIAPAILENLDRFFDAVDASEFDRSPDPPLQSFGALVTLRGDRLELSTMRRLSGGHAGTGERWHLSRTEAPSRLPAMLLTALGERPEDVPRLMARLGSKKKSAVQQ